MAAVENRFWNGATSASSSLPPTDSNDHKGVAMGQVVQAALSASAASSGISLASRSFTSGDITITFSTSDICSRMTNKLVLMDSNWLMTFAKAKKVMDLNASASDINAFINPAFDLSTEEGLLSKASLLFDLSRCRQEERPKDVDTYLALFLLADESITKIPFSNIEQGKCDHKSLRAAIKYGLAVTLIKRNNPGDEELIRTYVLTAKALQNRGKSICAVMKWVIHSTLARCIDQGDDIGSWLKFIVDHSASLDQGQLVSLAKRLFEKSEKIPPAYAIQCLKAAQTLLSRDDLIATDDLKDLKNLILQRLGELSNDVDVALVPAPETVGLS